MPFKQLTKKKIQPESSQFTKIECERSGTIYYEHIVTKQQHWSLKSIKYN